MPDLSPTSREHLHTDIGTDTFVLSPSGTPIRFTPLEKKFLVALDQTHNLSHACDLVQKSEDWAKMFFRKPKIHEWMTKLAQEQAAKSGMTVNWIRGTLLAVIRGKETFWEGECGLCHVKQKTWLIPNDDKGVLTEPCLACDSTVLMNEVSIPIKMDRQQMVALQELSARIDPKVERISHEFSDETFSFQAKE